MEKTPSLVVDWGLDENEDFGPSEYFAALKRCSQILPQLYLGSEWTARDKKMLLQMRVTHILNAANELPNYFEKEEDCPFVYLKVPLHDDEDETIVEFFDKSSDFIHSVLGKEPVTAESESDRRAEKREETGTAGSCFVHCAAGVSRSASLVLAYLMKFRSLTLKEAFGLIFAQRPIIGPNEGYAMQLYELEKKLFGSNSVELVPREDHEASDGESELDEEESAESNHDSDEEIQLFTPGKKRADMPPMDTNREEESKVTATKKRRLES